MEDLHQFFRRHWQRALQIREKIWFSEEAFHLVLAGGVGVIGGLVNLFFYYSNELVKKLFFLHPAELVNTGGMIARPGDPVEVSQMMTHWERVLTPTLGGLCAGLVLYWGLRLAGPQRSWQSTGPQGSGPTR